MNDANNTVDRLAFAVTTARAAGRLTLEHFRVGVDVETKADGSEVSIADRRAEAFIRDAIADAFPADAILGEEDDDKPGTSGWRWVIDPIDGTFSFVRGVPLFATLLAAERVDAAGDPIPGAVEIGVLELPALSETIHAARGHGAWHSANGGKPAPARVSDTATLANASIGITTPDYFRAEHAMPVYERLITAAGNVRGWPDAYAFALVATGRCDAVAEPFMKPWDCGPMLPIIEEAGGRVTDWAGNRTIHAGNLAVSNGHLHPALLGLLDRPMENQ
jgi:histidinol phosphatase-like enzyme (inositol monophosphatase family)